MHGLASCNMASVVSCFCGCVYLFEILLSLAVTRRHSKTLLLATAAVDVPSVHTYVHQGSWPSRPCSLESLLRQLSFDDLMIMIQVVNIQDHTHRCHQFASSVFFFANSIVAVEMLSKVTQIQRGPQELHPPRMLKFVITTAVKRHDDFRK